VSARATLSGVGGGPVLPLGAWLGVSGTSRSFVVGGARRGVVCRPAVCAQQRGVGGRELHWRGLDAATPDADRQRSCNTRRGRRRCRRRPRRHRRARIGSRAGSWCSPRLGHGRRWKHASQAAAGPAARDITQRARSPVRRVCRRARQGPPTLGCWPRPRAHVPRIEDRRDVSPTETALGIASTSLHAASAAVPPVVGIVAPSASIHPCRHLSGGMMTTSPQPNARSSVVRETGCRCGVLPWSLGSGSATGDRRRLA
jgi:hypothetical protein